jgi:hypothetical protein
MTELLQRLSIRMDGATISGYFFAFSLLQIIVSISFVLPALELSQLRAIGTDIFFLPSNSSSFKTSGYLSLWAIEWAIFGAFVYSFVSLMDRIPRKDVTSRYYLNVALRYIFAVALASLFFLIYNQATITTNVDPNARAFWYGSIAALSFTIGMFPNRYFRLIASFLDKRVGKSFSRDIPLERFTGINADEATRLWEEGVNNVDQLADHSVQELYAKTKFEPNRLRSLIGRALFWKYVYGIENMLVALKIEEPKMEAARVAAENRIVKIMECRFSDIQGLCAFLFSRQLEDIDETDVAEEMKNEARFRLLEDEIHIPKEILQEVVSMALFFKKQLSFIDAQKGIQEIVREELVRTGTSETQYVVGSKATDVVKIPLSKIKQKEASSSTAVSANIDEGSRTMSQETPDLQIKSQKYLSMIGETQFLQT